MLYSLLSGLGTIIKSAFVLWTTKMEGEWQKRKNRKEKKEDVTKMSKVKGEEHINHVGKLVSARRKILKLFCS